MVLTVQVLVAAVPIITIFATIAKISFQEARAHKDVIFATFLWD